MRYLVGTVAYVVALVLAFRAGGAAGSATESGLVGFVVGVVAWSIFASIAQVIYIIASYIGDSVGEANYHRSVGSYAPRRSSVPIDAEAALDAIAARSRGKQAAVASGQTPGQFEAQCAQEAAAGNAAKTEEYWKRVGEASKSTPLRWIN